MRSLKFCISFCFMLSLTSCQDQGRQAEVKLYHELVSDLSVMTYFTHIEMKEYYLSSFNSKPEQTCADSLVYKIYLSLEPMFEKLVNAGGGLDPNTYYLKGDMRYDIAGKVIEENSYDMKVSMLVAMFEDRSCSLSSNEQKLVAEVLQLMEGLKELLVDAKNQTITLGNLYYQLSVFEGRFLLKGVELGNID